MGTDLVCSQRGSVLMLMPAAVLILVILSAVALDRAVVFGAQRSLVDTAQAAANNGAGGGLDIDELRSAGTVQLDPGAVVLRSRRPSPQRATTSSWRGGSSATASWSASTAGCASCSARRCPEGSGTCSSAPRRGRIYVDDNSCYVSLSFIA